MDWYWTGILDHDNTIIDMNQTRVVHAPYMHRMCHTIGIMIVNLFPLFGSPHSRISNTQSHGESGT